MAENPYSLWNTRRFMGVWKDQKPTYNYWRDLYFGAQLNSTDEWIDFEKLPVQGRVLAPFVMPLASGKPVYQNSATGFRFKPAYVKTKDVIDPLAPLTKKPGLDRSMLNESEITPMQRRDLIRLSMAAQQTAAIERRLEWMAARAIIDAGYTVSGEEYPTTHLDFLRAANQTIVKTSGTYWGDTGISIFDDIQLWCDRMFEAPFGGYPNRMTIGSKVWAVLRKDQEFMQHMDTTVRGAAATIERGIISSEKVVKVGELVVGGGSGATIEVILYRDSYVENGVETLFMNSNDIVLTTNAASINGYQCFGAIIDPYAQYQSMSIFPRNWMTHDDPAVEWMLMQSAPLMVPINPNGTLKATVVAA